MQSQTRKNCLYWYKFTDYTVAIIQLQYYTVTIIIIQLQLPDETFEQGRNASQ